MDQATLEIVSDSESDSYCDECTDSCSECEEGVCTSCNCELGLDENMYYLETSDTFYCKECWADIK